jgi:type VI secretion system secreted protein Hcp
MAMEIFLQLAGITGESQKTGAVGQIEVFSFSNGASNHGSSGAGTGSGAGKVSLSEISIMKQLDSSTPNLFLACCQGTHIATGTMIVRESTGGTNPQIYYQYDLTEVFINSIQWSGSEGGSGKPSESVSMSFKSIQITYTPQNEDGTLGSAIEVGWNVSLNAKM